MRTPGQVIPFVIPFFVVLAVSVPFMTEFVPSQSNPVADWVVETTGLPHFKIQIVLGWALVASFVLATIPAFFSKESNGEEK